MRHPRSVALAMAAAMVILGATTTRAQDPAQDKGRYSSDWNRPSAAQPARPGQQRLDAMIGELRRMIDDARKARAADPVFLRDLSDLARRYAWPWHVRALVDDFRDGDLTRDPAWTVEGGEVRVERHGGLRTVVTPWTARREPPDRDGQTDRGDIGRQILGALLQAQQDRQQADRPRHRAPREAQLTTPVHLSNAFALQLVVVSGTRESGRLEFGVTQGRAGAGYRVAYNPHGTPGLEILRLGRRGTSVIDATRQPVALEDGQAHTLQLTRARGGRMVLSVDGKDVVDTVDRAFEDDFDGVVIRNAGGDFTIRRVAAYGAR